MAEIKGLQQHRLKNSRSEGLAMAMFERSICNQKFDNLLHELEQAILNKSSSAELEVSSDFREGEA